MENLTWALIYIKLLFPETGYFDVDATFMGSYATFNECAMDREYFIMHEQKSENGFPLEGTQVVCIRYKEFIDIQ